MAMQILTICVFVISKSVRSKKTIIATVMDTIGEQKEFLLLAFAFFLCYVFINYLILGTA